MSENDPRSNQTPGEDVPDVRISPSGRRQSESSAFHSQFESFTLPQFRGPHNPSYNQQQSFDMNSMAGALPHPGPGPMNAPLSYGLTDTTQGFYPMQQSQQFQGMQYDPAARFQQQQYQQSGMGPHGPPVGRPQLPLQPQGQYGPYDPYAYNIAAFQPSPVDPRIGHQKPFGPPPNAPGDFGQFARRASEPAPVPSYPRGPPRKPKQSGHALWVGNLPPAATITDLKDHFSRDATKDIESLFLISKSNCAFVNYRTEGACIAAMNRFHDSRFHGVRLVCRLRRGAATASVPPVSEDVPATPTSIDSTPVADSPVVLDEPSSPTIVGGSQPAATPRQSNTAAEGTSKVPEKYFVVKSLTVQDLEASVRNQTWATQSHNEEALNRAYEEAENVYLIFSANKSGEYFGYARMASRISGDPVNLNSTFREVETQSTGVPQSIQTPATATAPKGRIIDDSARGTIFWEAELSDAEGDESPTKDTGEGSDGQNWGRQFAIEWMSTTRLPFYRTRGLRNPWNANREVKIARDGTEIEPSVGRRLVQMFPRSSTGLPGPQPGARFN